MCLLNKIKEQSFPWLGNQLEQTISQIVLIDIQNMTRTLDYSALVKY